MNNTNRPMRSAQETQTLVARSLRRRYWAERRFRIYGLTAVIAGMSFLVCLFFVIFSNGLGAFRQTQVRLDVFYDPAVRPAPRTRADYLSAEHATVVYEPRRSLDLDQRLLAEGIARRFAVVVPQFSALPAFLRGTPLLATAPGLLSRASMQGLASCEPPVPCPALPMYALWHARHQQDEAHRWLRAQLQAVVGPALQAPGNSSVSTSARACAL